jgi:hypothetical protein
VLDYESRGRRFDSCQGHVTVKFDDVSKAWASAKLTKHHVAHTAIRNVDFDIMASGGCVGHGENEYCYCDTSADVDITIYYFNKTKKCSYYTINCGEYSLGSLLKELVEW